MDGHVDGRHLEFFEEDFQHFLPVLGGIHVGFGQQDGALVGRDLQQREGVFPEELHVIPVVDDAVGDGVLELVESALVGVELLSDVGLQLIGGVGDDDLVLGPADAEWAESYIEGKTWGRFSSPLKPTFISPLP